jgi:hypothetical protein
MLGYFVKFSWYRFISYVLIFKSMHIFTAITLCSSISLVIAMFGSECRGRPCFVSCMVSRHEKLRFSQHDATVSATSSYNKLRNFFLIQSANQIMVAQVILILRLYYFQSQEADLTKNYYFTRLSLDNV